MNHAHHLAATVLTCGLWLPLWVLCGVLGWVVPFACTVCGNPFRRNRYVWHLDGRKHHLCPHCNRTVERRNSSRAMSRRNRGRADEDDENPFAF